eukprot:TRINITY_DN2520_c0_g1_i1.p1 TRINITY_DN2520_c0_g1~~TRINITY_DN2520_c0_g1_i1.p1  ORF type:complete len:550 (-),score=139.63 TRINITY_DN2520_c0_g1_i1:318-1967(-)
MILATKKFEVIKSGREYIIKLEKNPMECEEEYEEGRQIFYMDVENFMWKPFSRDFCDAFVQFCFLKVHYSETRKIVWNDKSFVTNINEFKNIIHSIYGGKNGYEIISITKHLPENERIINIESYVEINEGEDVGWLKFESGVFNRTHYEEDFEKNFKEAKLKKVKNKIDISKSPILYSDENGNRTPLKRVLLNFTEQKINKMLKTTSKNFKKVEIYEEEVTKKIPQIQKVPLMKRKNLQVPNARCFVLENFMNEEECKFYIEQVEKIGFDDLKNEFDKSYRSNDRSLVLSEKLAEILWERMKPCFDENDFVCVRPMGFGNQGIWKPVRLNECFKFGRYKKGNHFSGHIDGPWIPTNDESSIFTVIIYLNEEFKGGETNFCDKDTKKSHDQVKPKTGSVLFFNHDVYHEGLPVEEGTKYIVRTEIMFRRINTEDLPQTWKNYALDKNYLQTLSLYKKSFELEREGDVEGFTDTYLRAIELQSKAQQSIPVKTTSPFTITLPWNIYRYICSFLSIKEITDSFTVSKAWAEFFRDGRIWKEKFRDKLGRTTP